MAGAAHGGEELDGDLQARIEAMAQSVYTGQAEGKVSENEVENDDDDEREVQIEISNGELNYEPDLSQEEKQPLLNNQEVGIVEVGEGEKVGEGFTSDAHVSYPVYYSESKGGMVRRRRFRDWCWLRERLEGERQAGAILPPLPGKHRADFRDRFSPQFIRRRQLALQRNLQRLMAHPTLGQHSALLQFLEADVLADGASVQSPVHGTMAAEWWLERVGELFSRADLNHRHHRVQREERFVQLDEQLGAEERSIKAMDGAMQRLCRAMHAEVAGWGKLATSLRATAQQLSALRATGLSTAWSMTSPSPSVAEVHRSQEATPAKDFVEVSLARLGVRAEEEAERLEKWLEAGLENHVQAAIHEWTEYAGEAREALRLRDQKQHDWAEIQAMRGRCEAERDLILGATEADLSKNNFSHYACSVKVFLQQKMDQVRGIDPLTSKQTRMARLEAAMADYQQTLQRAQEESQAIDQRIEMEMMHWRDQLRIEWLGSILPLFSSLLKQYGK